MFPKQENQPDNTSNFFTRKATPDTLSLLPLSRPTFNLPLPSNSVLRPVPSAPCLLTYVLLPLQKTKMA